MDTYFNDSSGNIFNNNEILQENNDLSYILEQDISEENKINFIKLLNEYEPKQDEILITCSIKKINELWKKDINNYISKIYEKIENKDKYLESRKDLLENKLVKPPTLLYDEQTKIISFKKGKNIFSNLRDIGCKKIPIITDKKTIKILKEYNK